MPVDVMFSIGIGLTHTEVCPSFDSGATRHSTSCSMIPSIICFAVESILPLDLAPMDSGSATPIYCEPTEAYGCPMIPLKWNALG
jgi:hypothetical protein